MNFNEHGRPETETYAGSDASDAEATTLTVNSDPSSTSVRHPHMLARLFASVFHPFIHVGNACEFGISGLLAEGTCVVVSFHTLFQFKLLILNTLNL